jgi:N-acetylmuramoyl-L-alanine amidase
MAVKRIVQFGLVLVLLFTTFAFTTTEAHAWSACGSVYVVQRGDWVAKIARKCGVSVGDLYAANNWLYYTTYIHPGDWLNIPGGYDPIYYCGYDGGSYYVVCRGDSLSGIASRFYGVTVWSLMAKNPFIYDANRIQAGWRLRLY